MYIPALTLTRPAPLPSSSRLTRLPCTPHLASSALASPQPKPSTLNSHPLSPNLHLSPSKPHPSPSPLTPTTHPHFLMLAASRFPVDLAATPLLLLPYPLTLYLPPSPVFPASHTLPRCLHSAPRTLHRPHTTATPWLHLDCPGCCAPTRHSLRGQGLFAPCPLPPGCPLTTVLATLAAVHPDPWLAHYCLGCPWLLCPLPPGCPLPPAPGCPWLPPILCSLPPGCLWVLCPLTPGCSLAFTSHCHPAAPHTLTMQHPSLQCPLPPAPSHLRPLAVPPAPPVGLHPAHV